MLSWKDTSLVAIDTETTGKYPLGAELCEVAAVKWEKGQVVDEWVNLVRPILPMSKEVIAIHHITNEMVQAAPRIGEVIEDFYHFIKSSVIMAHHAPFDLGFLAWELEKSHLPFPSHPILCTSLLSRQFIPKSPNHRLQTLISFLKLNRGSAHRALDDAKACLKVGLECLRRCEKQPILKTEAPMRKKSPTPEGVSSHMEIKPFTKQMSTVKQKLTIQEIETLQGLVIRWEDYSINALKTNPIYSKVIQATLENKSLSITYARGSRKGEPRYVKPIGLVRNPKGDFLVASDGVGHFSKRYFLDQITNSD